MISRTFDIPEYTHMNHPRKVIFARKSKNGWKSYSTQDYYQNARYTALGFLTMGIEKGDKVGTIVSNNIPEWNILDMGLSQIGAIHVPIYPTLSYQDLKYILSESHVKYLFISDNQVYQNFKSVLKETDSLKGVYSIRRIPDLPSYKQIIQRGKKSGPNLDRELQMRRQSIRQDDPVTLIFSSGTTGIPKGVLLSHHNLVSNILASSSLHPLKPGHRVLSFLPLSHIYERTSNYQWQISGLAIYYAENIGTVLDNMKAVRPHGFTAVPRVLEKIRDFILDEGQQLKGLKRSMYQFALRLAIGYPLDHKLPLFYRLKVGVARTMIFRSLHKAMGGKIRFIGCGGAKLSIAVERFFWTAGLPVFQGYGLTETSPLVSLNRWPKKYCRIGTVGPLIPGVKVKIASDGEILCKGPNIMLEYYNDPELTARSMDGEGWFYTGDTGEFIDDRFLFINGRKKDLFKTSYGKYIAPQVIESRFRESPFIAQVMVIGEGKKFAAALIIPNFDRLIRWAKAHTKMRVKDPGQILNHTTVRAMLDQEVQAINESLGMNERIRAYEFLSDEWTVRGGELSPSLKLRREYLQSRYKHIIDNIFDPDKPTTLTGKN